MREEATSFKAGANYVTQRIFTFIFSFTERISQSDADLIADAQFKALSDANAALISFQNNADRLAKDFDKMADAIAKGDLDGIFSSVDSYQRNVRKVVQDVGDIEFALGELEKNRKIFEGASKAARDFFIDTAAFLAGTAAIGAISKTRWIAKMKDAARVAEEGGRYWYQTWEGVALRAIPKSIDATFTLVSTGIKEGEITASDAVVIMVTAYMPFLSAKLPEESKSFLLNAENMLSLAKKGKKTLKEVAEFIKKNMPPNFKELARECYEFMGRQFDLSKGFINMPIFENTALIAKNFAESLSGMSGKAYVVRSAVAQFGRKLAGGVLNEGIRYEIRNEASESSREQEKP
ncbi:MAG: hypothetical protein QXU54_00980 [Candidatus Micrarchaeia archaeon]